MIYIYPKLPAVYTTPFMRVGGNGLANCLFVYAKAIVLAQKYQATMISPAWFNFSIGTYLRNESDKRHYLGIINHNNEVCGLRKLFILLFTAKTNDEKQLHDNRDEVLVVEGIYDFFKPLLPYQQYIHNYLIEHINHNLLKEIDSFDFSDSIAVHVRLGDFPTERRVPMEWYVEQIRLQKKCKNILLFSDGTDEELEMLLSIPNVKRVYFGGAIQDIVAISKCSYLIGSDSSFSAWGAFLGQVPCIFYRLQFGSVLNDSKLQIIEHKY